MPFGLDFKSIVVGVLLGWFVVPWLMAMFAKGSASEA
jgi:predicted Na+-dependent transporter